MENTTTDTISTTSSLHFQGVPVYTTEVSSVENGVVIRTGELTLRRKKLTVISNLLFFLYCGWLIVYIHICANEVVYVGKNNSLWIIDMGIIGWASLNYYRML